MAALLCSTVIGLVAVQALAQDEASAAVAVGEWELVAPENIATTYRDAIALHIGGAWSLVAVGHRGVLAIVHDDETWSYVHVPVGDALAIASGESGSDRWVAVAGSNGRIAQAPASELHRAEAWEIVADVGEHVVAATERTGHGLILAVDDGALFAYRPGRALEGPGQLPCSATALFINERDELAFAGDTCVGTARIVEEPQLLSDVQVLDVEQAERTMRFDVWRSPDGARVVAVGGQRVCEQGSCSDRSGEQQGTNVANLFATLMSSRSPDAEIEDHRWLAERIDVCEFLDGWSCESFGTRRPLATALTEIAADSGSVIVSSTLYTGELIPSEADGAPRSEPLTCGDHWCLIDSAPSGERTSPEALRHGFDAAGLGDVSIVSDDPGFFDAYQRVPWRVVAEPAEPGDVAQLVAMTDGCVEAWSCRPEGLTHRHGLTWIAPNGLPSTPRVFGANQVAAGPSASGLGLARSDQEFLSCLSRGRQQATAAEWRNVVASCSQTPNHRSSHRAPMWGGFLDVGERETRCQLSSSPPTRGTDVEARRTYAMYDSGRWTTRQLPTADEIAAVLAPHPGAAIVATASGALYLDNLMGEPRQIASGGVISERWSLTHHQGVVTATSSSGTRRTVTLDGELVRESAGHTAGGPAIVLPGERLLDFSDASSLGVFRADGRLLRTVRIPTACAPRAFHLSQDGHLNVYDRCGHVWRSPLAELREAAPLPDHVLATATRGGPPEATMTLEAGAIFFLRGEHLGDSHIARVFAVDEDRNEWPMAHRRIGPDTVSVWPGTLLPPERLLTLVVEGARGEAAVAQTNALFAPPLAGAWQGPVVNVRGSAEPGVEGGGVITIAAGTVDLTYGTFCLFGINVASRVFFQGTEVDSRANGPGWSAQRSRNLRLRVQPGVYELVLRADAAASPDARFSILAR